MKKAIIVLHEIYGINEFMQEQCQKFKNSGFAVFCPNMIGRPPFSYEKSKEAYDYFMKNVGFEVHKEINILVNTLTEKYDRVFIIGFSAGATIAWRCCENVLCSGIISCYGSRIRDYADLTPASPTLLLFAKEDSFDVNELISKLQSKKRLSMVEFDAKHGFVDPFSNHFNPHQSKRAEKCIARFIQECSKRANLPL